MTTNEKPATLKGAEEIREELTAALHAQGITLPSLRIDAGSWSGDECRPLMDLGRCNLPTAHRLAQAVRGAGTGGMVRDEQRPRVGIVMGHCGGYLQLRPIAGGLEWDARPEHVVPVGRAELLSVRVSDANQRSRNGGMA